MYTLSNSDTSLRNTSLDAIRLQMETLETAAKMLDKHMDLDGKYINVYDKMKIKNNQQVLPTISGGTPDDYPRRTAFSNIKQLVSMNKVPLPEEIVYNFSLIQKHSLMGLFPEIHRAWLVVDGNIYIWDFESRSDICFYDGVKTTIIGVGLVKPKPNLLQKNVKYLLVLSTEENVTVLGMNVPQDEGSNKESFEKLQLVNQPLYCMPIDGVKFLTIKGSDKGRIFLGGDDGNIYEVEYQKDSSWFSKSCRLVNMTMSPIMYVLPQFLTALINEEAEIVQICIDNSRHIMYTRSINGRLTVVDLCADGNGFSCLVSLTQDKIVEQALGLKFKKPNSFNPLHTSLLKPIISITAIEAKESLYLGLIAICESGTRLYFSTGFSDKSQRPSTLELVHVRLPPTFNTNIPTTPTMKANVAHYSRGNLVMTTTSLGIEESIRCYSSDPYPLSQLFTEFQTCLMIDSKPWILEEVQPVESTTCSKQEPPMIVRQHYERLVKYVALGPSGVEIFAKLRPVDMLAQLFKEGNGPDSQSVKQYFIEQTEDQACATCLVLACNNNSQNITVTELAKRAFFLYGGEPKLVQHTIQDSHDSFVGFNPNSLPTPRLMQSPGPCSPYQRPSSGPNMTSISGGQPLTSTLDAVFSSKHNGLYFYVSRILRPIWNIRVVLYKMSDTGLALNSSITLGEVSTVTSHLQSVRSFIENNPTIMPFTEASNLKDRTISGVNNSIYKNRLLEVYTLERRSLEALKTFIDHSCQILGFWKILCEHHFPTIASFLTEDQKNQLTNLTFAQLITNSNNHEQCTLLMNNLLNYYLVDNTPIQSVTFKLSEVCPKIFKNEDATCAKANELVMYAKKKISKEEKEQYLRNSIKLYKEVIPHINLKQVCNQYATCQFYDGVINICLDYAKKIDQTDSAIRYFYNQTLDGEAPYVHRLECYNEIVNVLEQLYNTQQSASRSAVNLPKSPGYYPLPLTESCIPSKQEIKTTMNRLINQCLASNDILLHASVYEWMIKKELIGELIELSKPSLEKYLIRHRNISQCSLNYNDLLWKYYEKHGNHAAAADILMNMAKTTNNSIKLNERSEYLAKAVLCMRNEESGNMGQHIHELQDLLQVSNVQKKILDAITDIYNNTGDSDLKQATLCAIDSLNNNLFDLTQLFNNYAEEFDLWECKLALIEIGNYNDEQLIQSIWQKILQIELDNCNNDDPNNKLQVIMDKVESLYNKYESGSFCFPLDFLIYQLEFIGCSLQASPEIVQNCFINMGIPFKTLIPIYEELNKRSYEVWAQNGDSNYLVVAIGYLAGNFVEKHGQIPAILRKQLAYRLQDLITNCLSSIYAKPNVENIVQWMKEIQQSVNDISIAIC